jgi:hypothetical protein
MVFHYLYAGKSGALGMIIASELKISSGPNLVDVVEKCCLDIKDLNSPLKQSV